MGNLFSKSTQTPDIITQQLIDSEVKRRIAESRLQELENSKKVVAEEENTYFGQPTMFPQGPGLAINVRTRGPVSPWMPVGIVYTKNPANNRMMTIEGQMVDIGRRRFRYRFINPKTGIIINYKGGKEMYELTDGDIIPPIPGLESLGPWVYQKNDY